MLPLLVGMALSPFRDHLPQEQSVLLLALAVVAAAAFGGRSAGALAAVVGAISFDFFLTQPYFTLAISSEEDVVTTLVLLAVGLAVGQLALAHRREVAAVAVGRAELASLFRVSRLAAEGGTADDVELAVRSELLTVLVLAECRFGTESELDRPILGPGGALTGSFIRYERGENALPDEGIAIAVEAAGHQFGYLLCTPVPGVGVSIERRRVAVALAAQLALARAAEAPPLDRVRF